MVVPDEVLLLSAVFFVPGELVLACGFDVTVSLGFSVAGTVSVVSDGEVLCSGCSKPSGIIVLSLPTKKEDVPLSSDKTSAVLM